MNANITLWHLSILSSNHKSIDKMNGGLEHYKSIMNITNLYC